MRPVQAPQDAGPDQPAERVGQRRARVEPGDAVGHLGAGVPGAHEEDGAGEEGGLGEAEHEAGGDEPAEAVGGGLARRDDAPDGHGDAEVQRGPHPRQRQVRRQLHQQVPHEQDRRRQVEVGPRHAQVGLERAQAGLGQVAVRTGLVSFLSSHGFDGWEEWERDSGGWDKLTSDLES